MYSYDYHRVQRERISELGRNDTGRDRQLGAKGMDFTGIAETDTLQVQWWVNEYPRGILDRKCAGRVLSGQA